MSADLNSGLDRVPGIEFSGSSRSSLPVRPAASGRSRFGIGLLLLGVVGFAAYNVHVKYAHYLEEESISALKTAGLVVYDDGRVYKITDPTRRCVTDACLLHIRDLNRAVQVDLSNCPQITDAGLAHLRGHNSICMLRLDRTGVTDAGIKHLAGMTSLEALDLSFTGVSDSGLSDLSDLKLDRLFDLHLVATRISDKGFEQLGGLSGLRYVTVGGTRVTHDGEKKLVAANPEVFVFGIK